MRTIRIILFKMALLILPFTAIGGIDKASLTKQTWKFDYAFKPISSEVVNRGDELNFVFLKFEIGNSFTLAASDKVEMGTWNEVTAGNLPGISFGFKGVDQWNVIYCDNETFVISNKSERGLLEYHFIPATSQKDISQFSQCLNTHIEKMQNMIKSFTPNNDNTKANIQPQIETPKIKPVTKPITEKAPITKNNNTEQLKPKSQTNIPIVEAKFNPIQKEKIEIQPEPNFTLNINNLTPEEVAKMGVVYKIKLIEMQEQAKEQAKVDANTNNIRSSIKKNTIVEIDKKSLVEIYVSGGGLKGGINPKIMDRIMINNNGVITKDYESKLGGKVTYSKKVPKDQIIKLAEYIIENGYFDFQETYTCNGCTESLKYGPQPIPLKIIISVGEQRHTVSIPVYAPGMIENANYPKELEKILSAIYDIAG